jgi:deoxyhypusine monooxygenase
MTTQISQSKLGELETLLLNTSGNVPLHNRFRALFTLKSLKTDQAVEIIGKGRRSRHPSRIYRMKRVSGFSDESALLKHELAYCLGQTKNVTAVPTLESVLANESEDPMVRHEVCTSRQPLNMIYLSAQWIFEAGC